MLPLLNFSKIRNLVVIKEHIRSVKIFDTPKVAISWDPFQNMYTYTVCMCNK